MNGLKISCGVLSVFLLVSLLVCGYLFYKLQNRPVVAPETCPGKKGAWNANLKSDLKKELGSQLGDKADCVAEYLEKNVEPYAWLSGGDEAKKAASAAFDKCQVSA